MLEKSPGEVESQAAPGQGGGERVPPVLRGMLVTFAAPAHYHEALMGSFGKGLALIAALPLIACASMQSLSAGQVGCDPSDITISNENTSFMTGVRTWTATCDGRTYQCTSTNVSGPNGGGGVGDISCAPASHASDVASSPATPSRQATSSRQTTSSSQATPSTEATPSSRRADREATSEPNRPEGAGGFEFGMARDDAADACDSAGGEWSRVGKRRYECSKAPRSVGFDARVQARLCRGKVCGIDLFAVSDSSAWLDEYGALREALIERYGRPINHVHPRCADENLKCLLDSDNVVRSVWKWSRTTIYVIIRDDDEEGLMFHVAYRQKPSDDEPQSAQAEPAL